MKFVKSKKSNVGDAWRLMHMTVVDFTGCFKIETVGKPAVPEDIAWEIDAVEVLKAFLKSWAVSVNKVG
jgi:hypothetical protein